jgi:hypothetical protein
MELQVDMVVEALLTLFQVCCLDLEATTRNFLQVLQVQLTLLEALLTLSLVVPSCPRSVDLSE